MSPHFEKEFADQIAALLQAAEIPFVREVVLGGLPVDFVVPSADGKLMLIETKSWAPTAANRTRAIQQAELFKQVTGADDAIVVLEGIKRGNSSKGVVSVDELVQVLASRTQTDQLWLGDITTTTSTNKLLIFAAMPFAPEYDDVYFVAMAPAAGSVNAVCKRVDQEDFTGDVVKEIQRLIHACDAVVVDLSEAKPNVLYEAGFAHALERPTVHICSTPMEQLPFDVRNWNTIKYSKGQTHKLKNELTKAFKQINSKNSTSDLIFK